MSGIIPQMRLRVRRMSSSNLLELHRITDEDGWGSNPRKVAICLEELGLKWKSVTHSRAEVRSDSFKELNPTHTVPVLFDGDVKIFESTAVIVYLARKYDITNKLMDFKNEQNYADSLTWTTLEATILSPAFADFKTYASKSPELKEIFLEKLLAQYQVLEDRLALSKSEFILDYGYSLADIAWITYCDKPKLQAMGFSKWSDKFPNIDTWVKRMYHKPSVQKAYGLKLE